MSAVSTGSVSPETIFDNFMNDPRYTHMFRNAQVVKKEAFSLPRPMFTPIMEPVAGNVVIVGDAGVNVETWIQGAVASAYMAVKAIGKELNGQKGYPEYIAWWQKAFHCTSNTSRVIKSIGSFFFHLASICSDEEVDYIYSLSQGRLGIPGLLVANNLELIKRDRPELYERLKKGYDEVEK